MPLRFKLAPLALAMAVAFTGCARKKHITPRYAAGIPQAPETGLASWYGHPYHGRPAADGEIYDMETPTAAHRTLPFNTWVRVTNLNNGKTVDVRIIDRGPFIEGRVIDLSHAAARQIDLIGPGVAPVRLDIISVPAMAARSAAIYAVQIGAFRDPARAGRLRDAMQQQFGSARVVLRQGNPSVWRVLVGSEPNIGDANQLAGKLQAQVGEALVVRVDNPGADGSAP